MKRGALIFSMALVAVLVAAWPALSQAIRTGGVPFTGTLGSTLTFSAVTTDITAASGEDVVIEGGASTGSVVIESNDNTTVIRASDGDIAGEIITVAGTNIISIQEEGGGGVVTLTSTGLVGGGTADVGSTTTAFTAGDP
jgi:hypothetical protein